MGHNNGELPSRSLSPTPWVDGFGEDAPPSRPILDPDPPSHSAGAILSEAKRLVGGDRHRTHGDKLANHRNIAALWSAFLDMRITPKQAALMMALVKIARTKLGEHNPDNYVDLAGYAGVAGEVAERDTQDR